ncbi:hypothetical protein MCUN1_000579 [Malassezia cuniculi]|uniref:Trafficking protein particle complex subunit 11 domain-containing protein n=1 Tax=Malassezia cuniculi TaxID=948313 RepID=A0AAF0J4T2_9BASI|nr:hypothetical protein MCUN1_000579 [Malassezia cuniculi]
MNTYPAELVAQLPPCMLASGLVRHSASTSRIEPLDSFKEVPAPVDVYPELAAALVAAHERNARLRIWCPPGSQRFRTVMVGHGHRVPPSKVLARSKTEDGQKALSALPPRSPLSPLLPGGPLFPDGIIAPSWIRKHIEYMPSVYVAYVCMSEDANDDLPIAKALAQLRATISSRGTRLVAVLVCADTSIATDERIAPIRRAAQLDAKTGVFVTSPSVDADAFCTRLDSSLLESAHEYYWERSWRVRRNRARYPPPPSVSQPIIAAATAGGHFGAQSALLSSEGWVVRTLYKLAVFSELQGAVGDALSLYSEAYDQLVTACLSNTSVLAPRTRRWAEAKVLADTLSFKICKYHLYLKDPAAAVAQFRKHTRRFAELSTGWGIGTSTPDFWQWLAKQFQLIGDLAGISNAFDASAGAGAGALAPTTLLLPPGSYYYLAALATLERASRSDAPADLIATASEHFGAAYDNLRKINRPRHALLAATRIGLVYHSTGLPDRAYRFLERALRTYKQDGFDVPQALLAQISAPAATARGDAVMAGSILLDAKRSDLVPGDAVLLGAAQRIAVEVAFCKETADVDSSVGFQVRVRSPAELLLQSVTLYAGTDVVLELAPGDQRWITLEPIRVGSSVSALARLEGAVISGVVCSDAPCSLRIDRAVAQVLVDNHVHSVDVAVLPAPEWTACLNGRPIRVDLPCTSDARAVTFVRKPKLDVDIADTALCGELLPLRVNLTDAPGCDILVALSDSSRAAGTHFPHSDEAYVVEHSDTMDVSVQVPQAPTTISLLVRALIPGDTPVILCESEHRVRIAAPFAVRAALHWSPARSNTPRAGHITLHVQQTAPCAFNLVNVKVQPAAASAVCAGAPMPLDEVLGEWLPGDSGVLSCPLSLADAVAEQGPDAPQVALYWSKMDGQESCTCVTLMPLDPAPPSEVKIDVVGPTRAAANMPFPLYIGVHNTSLTRMADVHVDISYSEQDYTITGPVSRMVAGLEPGETRKLTIRVIPHTVSAALALPRVYAWEDAMQGGIPTEVPVPVTGRPAAAHIVPAT